jgi:hypothetical protein
MTRWSLMIFSLILSISAVQADDNFCRKCNVMREYHKKNPSKYTYYDDYLKDVEEKGADAVNPRFEDLPEDVQAIVDPAKKNQKKSR